MGMEESGWGTELLKVARKFVILEGIKDIRRTIIDIFSAGRRDFPLVDDREYGGFGGGRGERVEEGQVGVTESETEGVLAAGQVRVIGGVEQKRLKRNCHGWAVTRRGKKVGVSTNI